MYFQLITDISLSALHRKSVLVMDESNDNAAMMATSMTRSEANVASSGEYSSQRSDPLQECIKLLTMPDDDHPPSQNFVVLTPVAYHENTIGLEHQESTDETATYTILDESMRELFYSTDQTNNLRQEEDGSKKQSESNNDDEEASQESNGSHIQSSSGKTSSSDSDPSSEQLRGSNGEKIDPFSEVCRIPLPGMFGSGVFGESKVFVRRRNERERARVRSVNDGFERLRAHLPPECDPKDRRLSKVETLRFAIQYIHYLQSLLQD